MLVDDEKAKMPIKVLKQEKPLSAISATEKAIMPAIAPSIQTMVGAKDVNLHRRRDAVVALMAKVGTRQRQNVRKKASQKGRSQVRNVRRARNVIGRKMQKGLTNGFIERLGGHDQGGLD